MTRVGWLWSAFFSNPEDRPDLLPGEVGGGEMCDLGTIRQVMKAGHEVTPLDPREWERAGEFDRVVISQLENIPDEGLQYLATLEPLVWVHHQQTATKARMQLIRAARPFVTMSALHARAEGEAFNVKPEICHGWIDLPPAREGDGDGTALWAARNHPQKGLINARMWAMRQGVQLREITDQPRQVVLDAMAEVSYFVFLPNGLDACPRTLIEAGAVGLDIHTNRLAGRIDEGPVAEVIDAHMQRFLTWM